MSIQVTQSNVENSSKSKDKPAEDKVDKSKEKISWSEALREVYYLEKDKVYELYGDITNDYSDCEEFDIDT